jgi:pimeloyl-ACP methyl ester carboxylesterase
MPAISLDRNTTISYDERGSGTPLVLLHGFPLDKRVFQGQLDDLSSDFRVIVPDLTSFGQSTCDQPFSIQSLAHDIRKLLAQIDALPCVLGGLSMGGYVSLAFAKEHPLDLKGLILIDTRAEGDTPEGRQKRNQMIELVRKNGSKSVADQMFPNMISPEHARDTNLAGELRAIMESCPPRTIECACAAMRDREDYTSFLPSIAVPTLILVGEKDVITPPKLAEQMHHAIPRSKLIAIPEAGHMTPMEKPEEVTRAIRQFAARL